MRHILVFGAPLLLVIVAIGTLLLSEQFFMVWMLQKHRIRHFLKNDNDDYYIDSSFSYTHPNLPRLILPPQRNETAVICIIAKEEDAFIEEWTDYYLGLGFAGIFVYDNSDTNELEQWGHERLNYYGDPVFVKHFPGQAKQKAAYRDCARRIIELKHDWILFIDGDEFLVIKDHIRFPHVVDMLQTYAKKGQLVIWWRLFGSSNRLNYEPIPVTKRFQYRVEDDYQMNHQFKPIVRTADLDLTKNITSPHWMPQRKGTKLYSTDGKFPNQNTGVGPDDVAVIHHYNFKSKVELIRKRSRGSVYDGIKNKWMETAKKGQTQNGDPVPKGTIFDDSAWQTLKSVAPRYAVYDIFYDDNRMFI